MNGQTSEDRQEIIKAVLHYFYQDNTRSGAHCRYNLKYHIVWIPKYRRGLLSGKIAERLKQILFQIAKEYGFRIIAIEVMPDHVHLLIEAPPKYAPSIIVGYLKGLSSKMLREEFLSEIRKYIWKENTLWARGYYIATLGDSVTTEIVQEYIENQKENAGNVTDSKNTVEFVQGKLF
jgi:putative transposase